MSDPLAVIVYGLGWGDEGKGATVDWLSSKLTPDRVVRFNGGQQAAHNVVSGPYHHTFQSYGSGTLSGVPTYISRYCTIDPLAILREQKALMYFPLFNESPKVYVSELAKVTTPLHVNLNRQREIARGDAAHGTTGRGFGTTVEWEYNGNEPLRAGHMKDLDALIYFLSQYAAANGFDSSPDTLYRIANEMRNAYLATCYTVPEDEFQYDLSYGVTIFEGAQGFGLDENYGAAPHTTWSTTTPANARAMTREAGIDEVITYGVLRTYATRHGAGPLPGECDLDVKEEHNVGGWAGKFRTGQWDPNYLRWAIDMTSPDLLALTHLDVYPNLNTTEGMLNASEFGDIGIAAFGPDREDRLACVGWIK